MIVRTPLVRFLPGSFTAITLGPVIILHPDLPEGEETDKLIRHETIHTVQWRELWYVGFAILYPLFSLILLIKKLWGTYYPYWDNPFEREAYENDPKLDYLETRPRFNWRHYFRSE